jgi:hypothetical protein
MRRILVCALLVAGCSNSTKLGPNDVELTINTRATAVNDQDLATVTALELTLSGSQNDHTRYDLTRPFNRAETVIVHLTKPTGDLTIGALARDGMGLVVAFGNTMQTLGGSDPHVIDVDLQPPASGTHAPSAVSITPSQSIQVFGNQSVALTASSPVSWSVAAGGAGGTIADATVTAMTSYKAPGATGSDQVIAASTIYFGEQASLDIGILTTGVVRYAGLPAGAGTVDGTGNAARIAYPRGLTGDAAGNVYFSEAGSNVVRKLDPSGKVTTLAGRVENNLWADGTGTAAGFVFPWGLDWDEARHVLYVADQRTVRKLDVSSGAVTTIAGDDTMAGIMDGTGSAAHFWNIWGAAYANNHLYVAEVNGNCIRDVDVTTGAVTTIVGSAFMAGYVDGAGTTARFSFPTSLALNGNTLYVGDSQNSLIRAVDLGTKMVSTLAGKQGVRGNTDGPKGTGTLSYPDQLTYDGAGFLYMANGRKIDVSNGTLTTNFPPNTENYPIQSLAFTPDGKLWQGTSTSVATINPANWQTTVVAGVKMSFNDYAPVDGTRWQAKFADPIGIAAAPDGTLVVQEGDGLRRIDPTTDTVTKIFTTNSSYFGGGGNLTVASDGTIYMVANSAVYSLLPSESYSQIHLLAGTGGFGYKDGAAAQAVFGNPNDLALVGKVLYLADSGNNVIRALDLNAGMVSTFAGTANMGGLVDMPGAAARFNSPQGIISDGAGNLYVASNNAVRKIVIAGVVVSTVAGGDPPGTGDGTGTAAKFNLPAKLLLDAQKQNLFVSDQKGTAIRKVTLPGGVVTTVAGMPGKPVLAPGPLPATINEPGALAFLPSGDLLVVVNHEQSLVEIRLP